MGRSDIEIAQAASMRPILDLARERLGIPAEALEPHGYFKAKGGAARPTAIKNEFNTDNLLG